MTTRKRREKTAAGAFEVETVRFDDDGLEAPPKSPPKGPARGKTVKGYILTAEGDLEQSQAVIVPSLRFQDLRRAKSSELPLPASPLWRLHEIEYSIDEGTYIAAVPLGSVYIAQDAGTVLVRAASLADLWGQIVGQTAPAKAPPACPTEQRLTGNVSNWIGFYDSRAGARSAAWGIIPQRAEEAGKDAFIDYECPNPACQQKFHGKVRYVVSKVKTHRSNVASACYLQAKYYATYEFTWAMFVRCS